MEKTRVKVFGKKYDWVDCLYTPCGAVGVVVNEDGGVTTVPISVIKVERKKRKDGDDNANV